MDVQSKQPENAAEDKPVQVFHSPDEQARKERMQNASAVTSLRVTRAQTAPGWEIPREIKAEQAAQAATAPAPEESQIQPPAPAQARTGRTYPGRVQERTRQYYNESRAQTGSPRNYYTERGSRNTRSSYAEPIEEKGERKKLNSLLMKTCVCVALLVAVLLLKYIDTPETATVLSSVQAAITQDMDIDDTLGKLQFVETDPDGSVAASANALTVALPGEVVTSFADASDGRVCIALPYGAAVRAPQNGTVLQTGDSAEGPYMVAECDSVRMTFYGLENIAFQPTGAFQAGETLGTAMESGLLYISAEQDSQATDPLSYF